MPEYLGVFTGYELQKAIVVSIVIGAISTITTLGLKWFSAYLSKG